MSQLAPEEQQEILGKLLGKPENLVCADCSSKKPCWVSLEFGVFVCMNCSGAHRALGPSVTRVRSTKLDNWKRQWVENMKIGNSNVNKYWEATLQDQPAPVKPTPCSTLCEIKKYVQDKYINKKYVDPKEDYDPLTKLKKNITDSQKPKIQIEQKAPQHQKPKISAATKQEILKFLKVEPMPSKKVEAKNLDLLDFSTKTEIKNHAVNSNLFDFSNIQTHAQKKAQNPASHITPPPKQKLDKEAFSTFSGISSKSIENSKASQKGQALNFDSFFEIASKKKQENLFNQNSESCSSAIHHHHGAVTMNINMNVYPNVMNINMSEGQNAISTQISDEKKESQKVPKMTDSEAIFDKKQFATIGGCSSSHGSVSMSPTKHSQNHPHAYPQIPSHGHPHKHTHLQLHKPSHHQNNSVKNKGKNQQHFEFNDFFLGGLGGKPDLRQKPIAKNGINLNVTLGTENCEKAKKTSYSWLEEWK